MRRFIAWKQAVINRIIHKPWIVGVRQSLAPAAFDPASMFTPTTPGWVYDLSDFSTLFQDSAGTTPVTAVEQPVGLWLDKSQGLAGADLIDPAIFTSTAGWVPTNCTLAIVGGGLELTSTGAAGFASAAYTLPATTKRCQLKGTLKNNAGAFNALFTLWSPSGPTLTLGTSSATPIDVQCVSQYPPTQLQVSREITAIGQKATFYTATVKELPGNHASQATTTKRPVLSSRVNLLTWSEDFTNAYWGKINASVNSNVTTAPDGLATADRLVESSANAAHSVKATGASYGLASGVVSLYAKADTRNHVAIQLAGTAARACASFNLSSGTIRDFRTVGDLIGSAAAITSAGGGWWLCSITTDSVVSGASYDIQVDNGVAAITDDGVVYQGNGASGVYIWGTQIVAGQAPQPYQRITTATSYDTVGFPLYLKGDGVDDFMSTAAIDFTGTDAVTNWYGVQKLQDATSGILYELGTDTNTVNGTFSSNAPESDGGTGFRFASRGTSRALVTSNGQAAPFKAVITTQGKVSTDTASIQINEGTPTSNGAEQGTGNYSNLPAYFGARAGTSLFFNGQLYSSVCLGRAATTEELDNTREWVNDRTGAY